MQSRLDVRGRGECQPHVTLWVPWKRKAEDAIPVTRRPVFSPEQKTSAEGSISAQGGMGWRPSSDGTVRQHEMVMTL